MSCPREVLGRGEAVAYDRTVDARGDGRGETSGRVLDDENLVLGRAEPLQPGQVRLRVRLGMDEVEVGPLRRRHDGHPDVLRQLGEHVDYAVRRSTPCAGDRGSQSALTPLYGLKWCKTGLRTLIRATTRTSPRAPPSRARSGGASRNAPGRGRRGGRRRRRRRARRRDVRGRAGRPGRAGTPRGRS